MNKSDKKKYIKIAKDLLYSDEIYSPSSISRYRKRVYQDFA